VTPWTNQFKIGWYIE